MARFVVRFTSTACGPSSGTDLAAAAARMLPLFWSQIGNGMPTTDHVVVLEGLNHVLFEEVATHFDVGNGSDPGQLEAVVAPLIEVARAVRTSV